MGPDSGPRPVPLARRRGETAWSSFWLQGRPGQGAARWGGVCYILEDLCGNYITFALKSQSSELAQ